MKFLIFLSILLSFFLTSCVDAGTLTNVNKGGNQNIEVFKYYYDDGEYVYIARFKDQPNVVSTTWGELHGKVVVKRSNVVLYENDSIQVVLKGKN